MLDAGPAVLVPVALQVVEVCRLLVDVGLGEEAPRADAPVGAVGIGVSGEGGVVEGGVGEGEVSPERGATGALGIAPWHRAGDVDGHLSGFEGSGCC